MGLYNEQSSIYQTQRVSYEQILNDKKVLSEYQKYVDREMAKDYSRHDMVHILNVVSICEKISKLLGLNERQIEDIKISALLHDIAYGEQGKENHAENSYLWAREYLQDKGLSAESREQILTAIKQHGKGTDTVYCRVLTFADKLDVTKQRILPEGLLFEGNRQYGSMEKIDFDIVDHKLKVHFMTNGKIDLQELNEYYFTSKIHKAIFDLARFFNLDCEILLDNTKWGLNE